jgi:hypothetical protein
MEEMVKHAAGAVFVGIGATAVLDIWIFALKALGVPTLNFALLGRWVGHMACGKWRHERIGNARPVRGELLWGWIAGAGVDVLSEEPPRHGNPLLEIKTPNLVITPHVAWASEQAMQGLADQVVANLEAFVAGRPQNLVT